MGKPEYNLMALRCAAPAWIIIRPVGDSGGCAPAFLSGGAGPDRQEPALGRSPTLASGECCISQPSAACATARARNSRSCHSAAPVALAPYRGFAAEERRGLSAWVLLRNRVERQDGRDRRRRDRDP